MIIDPNKQLNPVYHMMAGSKHEFVLYKNLPETVKTTAASLFITYAATDSARKIISLDLEAAGCDNFPVSDYELPYDRSQSNVIGYRYVSAKEMVVVYILTDYEEFKELYSTWSKAVGHKATNEPSFEDFAASACILSLAGLLNFNQAKKGK